MSNVDKISLKQAKAFLAGHLGAVSEVSFIGKGAWSQRFGFRLGDDELVIRFGHYVEDFYEDQRACTYASPELPIPQVLEIGQAFERHYALSTRAHAVPLESLDEAQWRAVIPAVVSVLEAMRTTDISLKIGRACWPRQNVCER
jgi:hypothetical protein